MNVMDKLNVKTTDFFGAVDVQDLETLSKVKQLTRGLVCVRTDVEKEKSLESVRVEDSVSKLDESIFDKVWVDARYEDPNLDELIRVTDNLGMVLVSNAHFKGVDIFNVLEKRYGIFDYWMSVNPDASKELLFKVNKY